MFILQYKKKIGVKKIFSLLFAIIPFFAIGVFFLQAAPESTLYFSPETISINNGNDFSLAARIDPGTNQVTSLSLDVTFDPTKLRLDAVDVTGGAFTTVFVPAEIDNVNGTASISIGTFTPVTADSFIADFEFHALAVGVNSSVDFTTDSIAAGYDSEGNIEPGNIVVVRNKSLVTITSSDTTPPTITNISSDKPNGTYTVGEVIDIDVTFSEPVTSTGNVTVTLETGTVDRTCTFTITNALTGSCNYTVQAGDTTSDLNVSSLAGTIKDQSDNTLTNFTPVVNLSTNKAIVIDTTAPSGYSVSIDQAQINTSNQTALSFTFV